MKRKSAATVLILLMSATLIAGCSKAKSSKAEPDDGPDNVIELADADESHESPDEEEPGEAEDEKSGETDTAYDFAGAFNEKQVYNNGNYFVRIRDKVYFRNIPRESMDEGATFGNFLGTESGADPCPLICYDMNTCEWEEIGKIEGTGQLYACPGGFYTGRTDQDSYENSSTYLYDPETGESDLYCRGLPCGVSDSGQLLAVELFDGQSFFTVLVKDGVETARLGNENIYYQYVGFAGETLIVILHNANEEYVLCSADEEGNVTELGMIGNTDNGYGSPEQFRYVNGKIYLCLGYYEGTGNFLSRWEVVKAEPGVAGSLETAINGDDEPSLYEGEGPDPAVPAFYFDTAGNLDYSAHLPYKAYMGDGDKENDLFCYNDIFEECLLVSDFIDRSNTEKCSIIQEMESITETAFVIYADAEADSEYDIGWRMGYRMNGWHICAIPFAPDHLDDNGLAKNIIYFEGGRDE